jgi:hypothetical protein
MQIVKTREMPTTTWHMMLRGARLPMVSIPNALEQTERRSAPPPGTWCAKGQDSPRLKFPMLWTRRYVRLHERKLPYFAEPVSIYCIFLHFASARSSALMPAGLGSLFLSRDSGSRRAGLWPLWLGPLCMRRSAITWAPTRWSRSTTVQTLGSGNRWCASGRRLPRSCSLQRALRKQHVSLVLCMPQVRQNAQIGLGAQL